MYFEDSLWLSEGTLKNIVGITYCVCGLCGICLNLITLTVLPEVVCRLGRPLLLMISFQLFVSILTLFCVLIPIPSMTAVERPFFINELLIGYPGVVLTTLLLISYALQLFISIYRNLYAISKRSRKWFTDNVMKCIFSVAVFIPSFTIFKIGQETVIRRFSLAEIGFPISDTEYLGILAFVLYTSLLAIMFYILSLSDLMYRHLFRAPNPDPTKPTSFSILMLHFHYFIHDATFVMLFCFPRILPYFIHSLISILGTAFWPNVSLIIYSGDVRVALAYRIHLMTKSSLSGNLKRNVTIKKPEHRMRITQQMSHIG